MPIPCRVRSVDLATATMVTWKRVRRSSDVGKGTRSSIGYHEQRRRVLQYNIIPTTTTTTHQKNKKKRRRSFLTTSPSSPVYYSYYNTSSLLFNHNYIGHMEYWSTPIRTLQSMDTFAGSWRRNKCYSSYHK